MVGVGYDAPTQTIYLHDTWDNAVHSMTWGGSYSGMTQQAVTVIHLAAPAGLPGTYTVTLSAGEVVNGLEFGNHHASVGNDNFADRINLGSGITASGSGNYSGYSTGETGEPAQSGTIHSAWWSWTAPSNGNLTVDTFGSGFDTYLTMTSGSAVNALTVLAQNDDSGTDLQSQISGVPVVAGTQYQFAVDGYLSDVGAITLHLSFTSMAAGEIHGIGVE